MYLVRGLGWLEQRGLAGHLSVYVVFHVAGYPGSLTAWGTSYILSYLPQSEHSRRFEWKLPGFLWPRPGSHSVLHLPNASHKASWNSIREDTTSGHEYWEASFIRDHLRKLTAAEGRGHYGKGKLRGGAIYAGTLRRRVGVSQVKKGCGGKEKWWERKWSSRQRELPVERLGDRRSEGMMHD